MAAQGPSATTTATTNSEPSPFSPYRPDGKLYGFICIVTGALQPIGRAIAQELATHGAACIYACCPLDQLSSSESESLVRSLADIAPKTKCIPYPLSISDEQATLQLIDEALNSWGRLDIWVCSSGVLGPASIASTTPADLQRAFEMNTLAPFFALKYAPPAMGKLLEEPGNYPNASRKDQKYGSIIVVSSVASTYGGCWGPCFTLSSHAALGVVRSGVPVLRGTGVRINCISPGAVDVGNDEKGGGQQQLPPHGLLLGKGGLGRHEGGEDKLDGKDEDLVRVGTPTEVARVAGFLASGFSSYVHGANLVVDGGATVMSPLAVPV